MAGAFLTILGACGGKVSDTPSADSPDARDQHKESELVAFADKVSSDEPLRRGMTEFIKSLSNLHPKLHRCIPTIVDDLCIKFLEKQHSPSGLPSDQLVRAFLTDTCDALERVVPFKWQDTVMQGEAWVAILPISYLCCCSLTFMPTFGATISVHSCAWPNRL